VAEVVVVVVVVLTVVDVLSLEPSNLFGDNGLLGDNGGGIYVLSISDPYVKTRSTGREPIVDSSGSERSMDVFGIVSSTPRNADVRIDSL